MSNWRITRALVTAAAAVVLFVGPAARGANVAYQNAVVNDGATVYYNFDGATPVDVKGNTTAVVQGTVTSGAASAVTGLNNAFNFSSGDVRIAHTATFPFDVGTGAFSIEMWYFSNVTARGDLFNYKGGSSDMGIFKNLNGTANNSYYHSNLIADSPANSATDNAWHYLAVTRTAAGAATVYRDGTSIATGTDTASISNTVDVLIGSNYGADQNTPAIAFNGRIDEFAFYPLALSQAQINNHIALAPEPASLGLLGVCALGLLGRRRRTA